MASRPPPERARVALAMRSSPAVNLAGAAMPPRIEPDFVEATPVRAQDLTLVTSPAAGDTAVPVADASGLGPPVAVQVADPGAFGAAPAHLLVWEFELRGPDGEPVPAQVLANGIAESGRVPLITDSQLAQGSLVLVPLAPLDPGVTYTAYFTARRAGGGAPVTRAWPFTTADG